ncbi:EAL domain-containing protein [Eubacteriaceae bacterium ES3]|nr:EAL domain-containing protein [Eubacteriaceae bacterium ES3]
MKKKILKNFLIIFFPILIIGLGIIIGNLSREKAYTIEAISSETLLKAENTSILIEKYMTEIIENLSVIRDANEMNNYANNLTDSDFKELNAMFGRVMNNKPDYDKIRFIDENGFELISVVRNGSGNENISLLDQSDSEYFKASKELKKNQIYISSIDQVTAVDDGSKLDVLRFAVPIYNQINQFKGILIIDYNASFLRDLIINQNGTINELPDQFIILTGSGEAIFNSEANQTDRSELEQISEIQTQIANSTSGMIENSKELITYYDVLNTFKQVYPDYQDNWLLLHIVDTSELLSVNAFLSEAAKPKNIISLFVTLALCLGMGFALEKIRQKDNQLKITMKIAASSNDAVIITDEKTVITYVNQAYETATGYTMSEVLGKKPSAYKSGKHSPQFYQAMWSQINATGHWEGMLWDRKKDGLLYPKKLHIIAVRGRDKGKAHHYIGIFTDLSSNKRKSDIFQALQFNEGQLVLPNENMMMELLEQSITGDNLNIMVMNIAIENYNQLISSFEGTNFNSSDVFISLIRPLIHDDDFVAQTGRNLFVVMVNLNNLGIRSERFAQKLYNEITRVMNVSGRDLFFKIRIGISYWPEDTNDLKKLLLNSMIALDWSQKNLDSEIVFFKEEMTHKLNQDNTIEGYLRKAIELNEFYLVYQPQIEIRTGDLIGMEALLRWNCEAMGEISPAVFIPIAEKSNLIVEIGNWVIENVCKDLVKINETCPNIKTTLRCAINISAIQMEENGFLTHLLSILNENHIDHSQIEVEITESILLRNHNKHVETLNKIRDLGIKISIDDFGTGYSSLSYLNALPVDKIKIDRSFIKNYPETDDGTLIEILVDMSKKLNKTVLTEGAETIDQVNYLEKIGCHFVQGYYYSKPLCLTDFIEYAEKMTVC